jgi:hypothetical protein
MYVRTKNELFGLSSGKAVVFSFRLDDTTRHSEMSESCAGPGWPGSFSVLCDKNIKNMRKARAVRYLTLVYAFPLSLLQKGGPSEGRIAWPDSQNNVVLGIGLQMQSKSQSCSDNRN